MIFNRTGMTVKFYSKFKTDNKAIRDLIVVKYDDGETISDIARSLKKKRESVSRVVNRWKKQGTSEKKASPGRPRSVRTSQLIKVVRERVRRNPRVKERKMSRELQKSETTIRRVLKEDLGLKAY